MKYIFVDTNIFIHFQRYDQISWKEIVGDDYRIVIAPIVLDELDKHKINSNKKIANRVKAILPKIEQEQNETRGIIEIIFSVPKDSTFEEYGLSKSQHDHALLATILEFGELNGLENVAFVSHDTGPRMRARQLGINVIQLDNNLLLPEEESQEEKELRKLRKENAELRSNFPDVTLTFDDGKKFKKFELDPLAQTEDDYCIKSLKPVKEKHIPFISEKTIEETFLGKGRIPFEKLMAIQKQLNPLSMLNQPTSEQKEEYNKELKKFYVAYEKIFRDKYQWNSILSNTVRLNFKVSNNGTASANDIDIFLTFPNTVKILLYENFPKYEKPKAPYKPKHAGDIDLSEIAISFPFNPPPREYIRVVDKTTLKNTLECYGVENTDDGSTVVHYKYSKLLKHNLQFSLEPIWAFSENSFKVVYKLLISNFPRQIEGELNIRIN